MENVNHKAEHEQLFCSVILPTIGRDSVNKSACSVLSQQADQQFELIVVNDSGEPLPHAAWHDDPRVSHVNTGQYRRGMSNARNLGAAIAKGNYLLFLDDDDWLLPNAFQTIYDLSQLQPQALWLYGGAQFSHETGQAVGEMNLGLSGNLLAHAVGGAWLPVQVSWIKATSFFEVGGFHPLFPNAEEALLAQLIGLRGDFAHTPELVSCILRGDGWSTHIDYENAPTFVRWARNISLAELGAFKRIIASAETPYWKGRVVHAYLASAKSHLRAKRAVRGCSAILKGCAALLLFGGSIGSAEFKQALKDDHVPQSYDGTRKQAVAMQAVGV